MLHLKNKFEKRMDACVWAIGPEQIKKKCDLHITTFLGFSNICFAGAVFPFRKDMLQLDNMATVWGHCMA